MGCGEVVGIVRCLGQRWRSRGRDREQALTWSPTQ